MEELQLLLSRLQPPSDEIVHECTLISEYKDLDSLGRERGEIFVAEKEEEEEEGRIGLSTPTSSSSERRENVRAFRADFLSSLTKVRESIGSNLIEREELGVVHFVDEDEAEVVRTRVKKKVLIEVIGDEDEDEEKSPNKKSQMWNDFALLLCGMMETSDGIPSWSSKQCSDRAKEMLEAVSYTHLTLPTN